MEETSNYCALCNTTENDAVLIDIELNSIQLGQEILDFCDLLSEFLNLRLTQGLICTDCQDKLVQFYIFKSSIKENLDQLQFSQQKSEILKKLDLYLEDIEDQPLTVLRYHQCFTIVPESQRSLMDNFQNWQPRIQLEKLPAKIEEIPQDPVEDDFKLSSDELPTILEDELLPEDFIEVEDDFSPKFSITTPTCEEILETHLTKQEIDDTLLPEETLEWIRKEIRDRMILVETEDGSQMMEWSCSLCDFTCVASKAFRNHLIQTHHDDVKTETPETTVQDWKCLKCEEIFTTEPLLRQHFNTHTTADDFKRKKGRRKKTDHPFTCKECWFEFAAQRTLDTHMRLHESLKSISAFTEIFSCSDCKMFFRSEQDVATHLNAGHAIVPATGIALQKTISFKRLLIPLTDEESSQCGHCGRSIAGDINQRSHILIHHVNPLVCPKDDRRFSTMQAYVCHIQKVHADLLPQSLACTHCKIIFDDVYARLSHMKLCKAKQFSCDHCEKRFSSKNQLNSHLKREMGLLSCECSVCSKVFKAKDELSIHMRTHTKEKPFKCSICEKSYTTTSARASHMETHKDPSIECEVCLVKFVARRHYIVHYKRYHDEDYRQRKFRELTCEICQKQFLRKDRLREHTQKFHSDVLKQKIN